MKTIQALCLVNLGFLECLRVKSDKFLHAWVAACAVIALVRVFECVF